MILRSRAIVLLALLLLAARTAWAQTDQGLPAAGAAITLKPTSSGYEVGIIIARDAKYTDAKISTTDSALGRILDQRVDKEAIPPKPVAPAATVAPAAPAAAGGEQKSPEPKPYVKLVTVVVKSGAIRQGSYPLTLILTGDGDPQVRDLALVVPPAKIDAPDTLMVVNDRWVRSQGQAANQPQIWETTQRAWLTNLSLDQKGNADAAGQPAGRIVPKEALKDIPPGRSELIELGKHYSLAGEFPLGTTKGKLVLQADQLAEPVTFSFEVRSRIWVCWLFLPMGIGLALGAYTRKILAKRLQLNQERENTYALIALIDRANARNEDATFRNATADIRQAAGRAADEKTAAKVKEATAAQQTAFQAALDALAKRRGDLDKDIGTLRAIVSGYYGLPPALAAKVGEVKAALEVGLPGLVTNNVAAVNTRLSELRDSLRDRTRAEGQAWVGRTAHLVPGLDILMPSQPSALTDLKTYWVPNHEAAATAVQQLLVDTTGAPDKVQAALQALHVGANALRNVTTNVAPLINGTAAAWDKALKDVNLPKRDAWRNWLQGADRLAADIAATTSTDPGDAVAGFEAAARALLDTLKTALKQQVADPDKKKDLEGLLEAGKLNEAVTAVVNANRPAQAVRSPEGRVAGRAPGAEDADAAGAPPSLAQFSPPAAVLPAGSIGFATAPRADLTPVDVLAAAAQRDIRNTHFLLSLTYAVLIALAGYFLFADKWIGEPLDFALVFFWAYATDIGADAATAAAKGVKRQ